MDLPAEANAEEEVTGEHALPAAPPPRPARSAAPPARPAARSAPAAAPPRAAKPAGKPAPRRAPEPEPDPEEPPEEDWRPKRPASAPAPQARGKERDASFTTPTEAIDEARAFFGGLTHVDKLAAGGVALLVVSLVLPWREAAIEGTELGIDTSGFLAALLGLGALGALFVRLRKPIEGLQPHVPWLAQVALTGLSAIVCLVFLKTASDSTPVPAGAGNITVWASKPSFGALIGLAGAVVGVVGSVLGFKGKQA